MKITRLLGPPRDKTIKTNTTDLITSYRLKLNCQGSIGFWSFSHQDEVGPGYASLSVCLAARDVTSLSGHAHAARGDGYHTRELS